MPKISALPAMTSADGADPAPIVDDSATTTKKITLTKMKEWLQSLTAWITTAMITDANVTPAKWTNPYKFYAYRSAAHNSAGSLTKVPYETEAYDSNNNFNTTNNNYTAPVAGFYNFHATAGNTAASSTAMQVVIFKNAAAALYGMISFPTGAGNNLIVAGDLQLAANDVIDVRFVGGGGSVMYTGITTCYFQGKLFTIT